MTKKLFVVLVVISALLITFSFVIAAKKAPFRHTPDTDRYEKAEYLDKQTATPMPRGSLTQPLEALPLANPISTSEARADKIPGYGPPQHSYEGVLVLQGGEDCATATAIGSLPHTSTGTTVGYADDYEVMDGVGCPYSSTSPDVVYSYAPGADEVIDIDLGGSSYDTKLFVYEDNCVNPAYACDDDYYPDYTSAIMELDIYTGHTYYIVVDGYGGDAGEYLLNVSIFEPPPPCSVVCPDGGIDEGEPVCYDEYDDQYNGGCNTEPTPVFQDVNCGDILCGTSGTFLFGGSNYRDTDWYRVVVAEDGDLSWKVVAEFPLLIFIIDAGSEDCSDLTILGSATVNECDTAFLSYPVTAGVYWLWVGPSVFSGVDCGVEYVGMVGCEGGGPENQCDLQHDNGSAASFFDLWVVGDEEAAYFDPAAECPDCDPVYPLHITEVQGFFYDFASAGILDVIVHFYEAGAPCDGPGAEIYSFAATVTDFYPVAWATIPLPDILCLEDDFFLSIEYNSGTEGSIPSLLFDTGAPVDTCIQWNYRGGGWIEWWDFWATPSGVGWLMLRAVGTCADEACDQGDECYMSQDQGNIAYINGAFEAGDQVVKYYNPEDYCEPEVYPYNIQDLDFLFYEYGGGGSVPVVIHVYLESQDSCDGPGTEIFVSDPFVPDLYPNMAHVEFDEPICVYEPFYIGWEYMAGTPGSTPSPLLMDGTVEPAEYCHAWFYKVSAGFWIEHFDFWSDPVGVGYPLIRVSGSTNHPECMQEACHPDSVETMADYGVATFIWALPSTSGRDYPNQRFTLPFSYGGRLDQVKLAFYNEQGTPSPDVYVWMSDGAEHPLDANPPYDAIATYHIDNANVVTYPSWQVIQTWEDGIYFDPGEEFHVGYSFDFSIAGDTLAHLSDDYTDPLNPPGQAGFLFPDPDGWLTIQEAYGIEMSFIMQAVICQKPPPAPTFVLTATPATAYISPGDVNLKKYDVTVIQIAGYDQIVDLDIDPATLPAGITYNYVPASGTPEFVSELFLSCEVGTPYATHTLTLRGTGPGKLMERTKDVTLIIQPPYDDTLVEFYHGKQRMTNFGAVGDHDNSAQSFYWKGISDLLFDGTFIVATGPDNMALDFGRTHVHTGFIPTQHQEITYNPEWPANIGFAEFYTDPAIIDTEWDSLFVIGIMQHDSVCTLWTQDDTCITDGWRYIGIDFSIKIKIYSNPIGNPPIEDMYIAMFEDWDFGAVVNAYNNWGDLDYDHNLVWMYEPGNEDLVCGLFKVPFYDDPMKNVQIIHNAYITWPNEGYGLDQDSVWRLLTHDGIQEATYVGPDSQDYSVMITAPPITLQPGERHIEIWIDFCRDLTEMSWEQWYHRVLRYAGFYRGDVNASDTLELPAMDISDLVYLVNYLYKGGPAPLPFADQGNVDGKGPYGSMDVPCDKIDPLSPMSSVDLADIVYLLNYVYRGGPPPIDYVRFIEQSCWTRESFFLSPFNVWP